MAPGAGACTGEGWLAGVRMCCQLASVFGLGLALAAWQAKRGPVAILVEGCGGRGTSVD